MNDGKKGGAPGANGPGAAVGTGKEFSMDEIAKHNNKQSCWVILNDRVLDVTTFLKDHPGGELAILTFAGKDATEEFNMIHPPDVIDKYLDKKSVIGMVAGTGGPEA